ncbi:hypothetical protein V5O48_016198 [Marasmius crinis-equi]|uniref:Uncharacterized protein n=1 Tax=Marasmius crinis-equi TaxID=585013 RepID=A0ABR3ESP8_9AGAR
MSTAAPTLRRSNRSQRAPVQPDATPTSTRGTWSMRHESPTPGMRANGLLSDEAGSDDEDHVNDEITIESNGDTMVGVNVDTAVGNNLDIAGDVDAAAGGDVDTTDGASYSSSGVGERNPADGDATLEAHSVGSQDSSTDDRGYHDVQHIEIVEIQDENDVESLDPAQERQRRMDFLLRTLRDELTADPTTDAVAGPAGPPYVDASLTSGTGAVVAGGEGQPHQDTHGEAYAEYDSQGGVGVPDRP